MSNPMFLDMIVNSATVMRHPPEVVWPHLLEQAAWMKDFRTVETVGGERNQEGELKKVTPFSPEYLPFFFKTLRLVPLRKFVYKAYTENRIGNYGFTGIEVLSLVDLGRESGVTFEAYLEFQSTTMTRAQLADYVAAAEKGSLALWERNFERLRALVESVSE